ncbi:hypothetical protein D3C84_1166080 [compost metagenome]
MVGQRTVRIELFQAQFLAFRVIHYAGAMGGNVAKGLFAHLGQVAVGFAHDRQGEQVI